MDFEFWWLLAFPLFFGLGWVAARIDIRQVLSETRRLPESYFQGLNFLVNEEADKAMEAFGDIASLNPETAELQFALGKLFRRNGEVARAIRIHQNLLDREDLPPPLKLQAMKELGLDYRSAGLLDRAEQVFLRLKDSAQHARQATGWLLEIYIKEKEWDKAIDAARWLHAHDGGDRSREIAHFYCEIAARQMRSSNFAMARQSLEMAVASGARFARVGLTLAELELAEGGHHAAIAAVAAIEAQNPAYLPLAVATMLEAHDRLEEPAAGTQLLSHWLQQHPSIDLMEALFRRLLAHAGPQACEEMLREHLRQYQTLTGLARLLETRLMSPTLERRLDTELIYKMVDTQSQRLFAYRCDSCGFEARAFYWQCPACGAWDSMPPRRIEELNMAQA